LNVAAVVDAGVPPDQVKVAAICTRCRSDRFFSHRAHGFPAGRFGAAIGLT
jgi:copper oxidase (laccase) domain-containing protein